MDKDFEKFVRMSDEILGQKAVWADTGEQVIKDAKKKSKDSINEKIGNWWHDVVTQEAVLDEFPLCQAIDYMLVQPADRLFRAVSNKFNKDPKEIEKGENQNEKIN